MKLPPSHEVFLLLFPIQTTSTLFLRKNRYSLNRDVSSDNIQSGMREIEAENPRVLEIVGELSMLPYFRYYCVDVLASCEYLPQEISECNAEACEIYPSEESEVRFCAVHDVSWVSDIIIQLAGMGTFFLLLASHTFLFSIRFLGKFV